MASYFEHKILSGVVAGADLSAPANLHIAVVQNSDGEIILAGAGVAALGFLQNLPEEGQFAEVAVIGGGSLAILAATLAIGVFCKADASGHLVAAGAGDEVIARILKNGVDNDHVDVQVLSRTLHA